MESISPKVIACPRAPWSPAVATLVRAFAAAPVALHLFPVAAQRPAGMAHIFRRALRYGHQYGRVDMIPSAGAVAIWIEPQYVWPSWSGWIQTGIMLLPLALGWRATCRMWRFERFIEVCQFQTIAGPHWYLFCSGVSPEQQGQGVGAALIRHGLQRAQATHTSCYLETANARNLPFYQQNGFRTVGQKHQPAAGPCVCSLVAGADR